MRIKRQSMVVRSRFILPFQALASLRRSPSKGILRLPRPAEQTDLDFSLVQPAAMFRQETAGGLVGGSGLSKACRSQGRDHRGGSSKRFGWHNLRHSLADFLAGEVDVAVKMKMLRHKRLATDQEIYAQQSLAQAAGGAGAVSGGDQAGDSCQPWRSRLARLLFRFILQQDTP